MTGFTKAADGRPSTGVVASAVRPPATAASASSSGSVPQPDDAVRAALDGRDPLAREALIDFYGPLLVAFAEARGASAPDDAASGVLLSLLREPASWPVDESALRSALFRALRLRLLADTDGDPSLGDESLTALDAEQRDLVLLRSIGGLDLAQVGVVLDRPVHSVKTLQRESIAALGQALGREAGPGDSPADTLGAP